MERRPDCSDFEPKEAPHQCGLCQTDGHYLCAGCRHIASFEDMELADNRSRYYPAQQRIREADEDRTLAEQLETLSVALNNNL